MGASTPCFFHVFRRIQRFCQVLGSSSPAVGVSGYMSSPRAAGLIFPSKWDDHPLKSRKIWSVWTLCWLKSMMWIWNRMKMIWLGRLINLYKFWAVAQMDAVSNWPCYTSICSKLPSYIMMTSQLLFQTSITATVMTHAIPKILRIHTTRASQRRRPQHASPAKPSAWS